MSTFLPKSIVCFREGYGRSTFFADLIAGITVGIVALPLAMAFGIASIPNSAIEQAKAGGVILSPPAMGLYTAVVAGFLISALGGSRVQIGGPTGAFIVIVYGICARHGYAGLATATLMAGVIVVLLGLARFGSVIKFVPYPVVTGFTSGIALIIFSSQIRDFLGLRLAEVPASFVEKWLAYLSHVASVEWSTTLTGILSLAVLLALRRIAPRIPGPIIVVILSSAAVALFSLPVATIGTQFGEIPRTLPTPALPQFSMGLARELLPDALTIAVLIAIESLLSAVVADGMTGGRHKADCELVAQGFANIGAVIFGGIPATGAIARTATNVKSGAKTPVAGMLHAVVLMMIMLLMAPLASHIPLTTLAAILIVVAWNMSEIDHFKSILRAPRSDSVVLLTTFALTVFTDLTIAVAVGMILACLLFIKRLSDVSDVLSLTGELEGDEDKEESANDPNALASRIVPVGVDVYEIAGPLFFGIASRFKDKLRAVERPPKVFILRMRKVPVIDATGLQVLEEFHHKCQRQGTVLILSGVHGGLQDTLKRVGLDRTIGRENILPNIDNALARATQIVAGGT